MGQHHSVMIKNTKLDDAGYFEVKASNLAGEENARARLTVYGKNIVN